MAKKRKKPIKVNLSSVVEGGEGKTEHLRYVFPTTAHAKEFRVIASRWPSGVHSLQRNKKMIGMKVSGIALKFAKMTAPWFGGAPYKWVNKGRIKKRAEAKRRRAEERKQSQEKSIRVRSSSER